MKEFELQYKDLGVGLRRESRTVRNRAGLVSCYNLVPRETSLEPYSPISCPFSATVTWPFPQIFTLSKYNLYVLNGSLYSFDEDFNLTLLLIGPGWDAEPWHVADFGTYVIMSNTKGVMYYDVTAGLWKRSFSPTSTYPSMSSVCNFNGQLIGCGVTSSWYDCDSNSVVWSDIGSLDLTLDQMNLSGYQHMPVKGNALCVKPLGKGVVIYGDTYVYYMYPAMQTFGFMQLAGYGIANRNAVAGNVHQHAFVDSTGKVRFINAELAIKELGFQEFLYPLLEETLIASFNEAENEYHFCTDAVNYILTEEGKLASHLQSITSIGSTADGPICMAQDLSDESGFFITDSLDFALRGQKTIQALEFGLNSDQDCQAAVMWKNNYQGSFTQSPYRPLNHEGVAHVFAAGSDIRAKFYTPDYSYTFVDSLRIKYKVTDKRFVRGIYANQSIA